MARGKKFDKRGGGQRLDAVSAEEIELRNQRLAEFEEDRTRRRAEAEEEEGGGAAVAAGADGDANADGKLKPASSSKAEEKTEDKPPVKVTSSEDHKKNMARLEAVRRRREKAEQKRLAEQEMETALEEERKQKSEARQAAEEAEDAAEGGKGKKKKSKEKEIPKLSKIEIKKMKPAIMKEALKERGLDIQGTAKILAERLVKYEAGR